MHGILVYSQDYRTETKTSESLVEITAVGLNGGFVGRMPGIFV